MVNEIKNVMVTPNNTTETIVNIIISKNVLIIGDMDIDTDGMVIVKDRLREDITTPTVIVAIGVHGVNGNVIMIKIITDIEMVGIITAKTDI